ncbi:MAG: hypothetical protein P4L91_06935 [Burkholderiaceae bacterium]|nr:hypothetical protein [Burkholderiaceae bacterium]
MPRSNSQKLKKFENIQKYFKKPLASPKIFAYDSLHRVDTLAQRKARCQKQRAFCIVVCCCFGYFDSSQSPGLITPAPFQVTGVFLFPTFPTKASYAQRMWGQDSQRRAVQESSLT